MTGNTMNELNCARCGKPLQADQKFCSSCGAIVEQGAQKRADGRICVFCGASIQAQENFCHVCGYSTKTGSRIPDAVIGIKQKQKLFWIKFMRVIVYIFAGLSLVGGLAITLIFSFDNASILAVFVGTIVTLVVTFSNMVMSMVILDAAQNIGEINLKIKG